MDMKKLNTTYEFTLEDGEVVKMSLTFYALYQLRGKNKSLYERYNRCLANTSKGVLDELDTITVLYAAYVCANLDAENLMSEEEFIMRCGSDRNAVGTAIGALINPKKATASASRS